MDFEPHVAYLIFYIAHMDMLQHNLTLAAP